MCYYCFILIPFKADLPFKCITIYNGWYVNVSKLTGLGVTDVKTIRSKINGELLASSTGRGGEHLPYSANQMSLLLEFNILQSLNPLLELPSGPTH